jgi:hypothetical protein
MEQTIELYADVARRTVYARATGHYTAEDMRRNLGRLEEVMAQFEGKKHIFIADMRGMTLASPEVAHLLGETIRYGRSHGTVLCIHISNDVDHKLQAARAARQNSWEDDDVTIDVESVEEAYRVAAKLRSRLDDGHYVWAIRDLLEAP